MVIFKKQRVVAIYHFVLCTVLTSFMACQKPVMSEQKISIAYVAKLKNETFHDGIAKGIQEEGIRKKIRIDMFFGKSQQDLIGQKKYLREIVAAKKYNAVMLAPNDSTALIEEIKMLDEANLPFILIDTPLAETPVTTGFSNDCGFVGTNNILAGQLAAQFIMNEADGGNYILMRGNHKHRSSIDREEGFLKEIQKSNNWKFVTNLDGWWEENSAYRVYSDYMKQIDRKVDAVFAYNDPMAMGVSRYYDENPQLTRPIIVGVDGVLLGQRGVLQKKISASVVQSPEIMGKVGLRNLLQCLGSDGTSRNVVLTPVTLLKASLALDTMGIGP